MKFIPLSTAVLLLAAATLSEARAPEPASRFRDAANGYSIEPPAFPRVPPGTTCQCVIFFASPEEGFAPNVNVQVQGGTLEAFVTASRSQFKEYGLNLLSEERRKVSGREAVAFDYEGEMQGLALRWLSLAVADGDRVILATATAPKASFETHEKALRACLRSLELGGK